MNDIGGIGSGPIAASPLGGVYSIVVRSTLKSTIQNLNITSGFVELHILDCSQIGGSIYRFTPNIYEDGTPIEWQGHTYFYLPITSSGWQITSTGTQPRPSVKVSNVNRILLNDIKMLGDLVGAKYIRYRTFEKYLDKGEDPNPNEFFPPNIFMIFQKTSQNKNEIVFQLCSYIDKPACKLPGRTVLKDAGFPGVSRFRV